MVAIAAPARAQAPETKEDLLKKKVLLPNGWSLTPAGHSLPLGDLPLNIAVAPSGHWLAVTNNGQSTQTLTNVPLGTKWSYVIAIVGGKIQITVNGATTTYPIASGFTAYHQYFKAGDYNQSSSSSTTNGAKVKFYSLTVAHN